MYPKWVEEVSRTPCAECHGVPTTADIIAIGTARPSKREAYLGPLAMIMVVCPGCGGRMYITLREPIQSVIRAMREFIRLADEEGRKTPPPFNFGVGKPLNADDARAVTKTSDGSGPLRPSRRENQPNTPPTQEEIQTFLRRLRKTSFRRKSKAFSDWMKELGADAGADVDDGDDS